MAELPEGYKEIPEEDRRKAKAFFDRGRTVADTGNYDYSIEMYMQGLAIDPDAIEAHTALREISLKRKASGGKAMGMFEAQKFKKSSKDDKEALLNAERLLAFDPGNTDYMLTIVQAAYRGGYYDTVLWIGPILQRANAELKSPDIKKFIVLKDTYRALRQWKKAVENLRHAMQLKPNDMELTTELKNLGAQETMDTGKYSDGGSFRSSMRDVEKQQTLIEQDKDIRSVEGMSRMIAVAEAELAADPNESGKLLKLVDALVKTEDPEYESRAIEKLQAAFERTGQFRFRMRLGEVNMRQMQRMERSLRDSLKATPTDAALAKDHADFYRELTEFELKEYSLWAENYPTESRYKFELANRLFELGRYDEAIPALQQVRGDPKYRADAGVTLGRSFLEAGYLDESADTFEQVIADYAMRGDAKSKEMFYWRARTLEAKGVTDLAIKSYSQVAQWDFNYRDVQSRIKALRAKPKV